MNQEPWKEFYLIDVEGLEQLPMDQHLIQYWSDPLVDTQMSKNRLLRNSFYYVIDFCYVIIFSQLLELNHHRWYSVSSYRHCCWNYYVTFYITSLLDHDYCSRTSRRLTWQCRFCKFGTEPSLLQSWCRMASREHVPPKSAQIFSKISGNCFAQLADPKWKLISYTL